MFGLFRRKSEKERLQNRYYKLLEEAYKLSKVNRHESDEKLAQADALMKKIELMA